MSLVGRKTSILPDLICIYSFLAVIYVNNRVHKVRFYIEHRSSYYDSIQKTNVMSLVGRKASVMSDGWLIFSAGSGGVSNHSPPSLYLHLELHLHLRFPKHATEEERGVATVCANHIFLTKQLTDILNRKIQFV